MSYVFSAPSRRLWKTPRDEYFEDWLEQLEAASWKVFQEIDASKIIKNLER